MRKYEEWTEEERYEYDNFYFNGCEGRSSDVNKILEIASREATKDEPSHKVIMSDWWRLDNGMWGKVITYDTRDKYRSYFVDEWVSKSWFTNRLHATIPPEVTK